MSSQEQRVVVIDSQRLSSIQTCMQKYKYSFIDNYEPYIKPDYFEKGELIHIGLASYYKLRKYRNRWPGNNHNHDKIKSICCKIMWHFGSKMSLDMSEIEENIKTFLSYTDYTESDGWDNILAVEQVGSFILWEDSRLLIVYEMKIDLIISLSNVPIVPVDHKTGKARQDPRDLDNQFIGYCAGLGVNNIFQNCIGFQKTLPPKEKFQRHFISYSDGIISEWKEQSAWWVRYSLDLLDRKIFPRNLTSCTKYRTGCTYKSVCKKEPELRQIELNTHFNKRDTWDVGKDL
jgi:hypothetical protein